MAIAAKQAGSEKPGGRRDKQRTEGKPADKQAPGVVIQGKRVTYPVVVRKAASASATYIVDAEVARRMLPAPELDVIEIMPGRALFSLACIDYVDNDLGDYNEVSMAFFVREKNAPRGIPYLSAALDVLRSRVSTFIFWLPVDQEFTREAGETMWGFPKSVEKIDFERSGHRATCKLTSKGKHVLTFSMPRSGNRSLPETTLKTYTLMDDRTCVTTFTSKAEGVGFFRSGVQLELGDHAAAGWLRELGLPKKPFAAVWMENMHARFHAAKPLTPA
jgi:hypothetical protein